AIREVVLILDGRDWNDATRCLDIRNNHFGEASMLNLALFLKISQRSELIVGRNLGVDAMQLEQVDTLDAQPSDAHLALLSEVFGSAQWNPLVRTSPGKSSLCGNNKAFGVRMQRLANYFFTDMRSVGICCVDKIDSEVHRTA